ncbi:CIC11C00000005483 [Sungouiella intermedia]|uniref:CIC11C00000005483 n=1 Tax=Sungouiella intermedia TaxID=45354 RepID=A0A1L0D7J2_9ASCO|nr:CIC11C00000005483 [[Candida] intermedia]
MKLYFEAEKFVKEGDRGLKNRIFNAKLTNSPKHVYALVICTLKYKEYINEIIRKSKLKDVPQIKKLKVKDSLLMLLVHDFLFSAKGRIQLGKHPIKDAFLLNKTRMQAELTKLKLKHKVKSVDQLPLKDGLDDDETPIRWIRVNTIKTDAESLFKKHAFFSNLEKVDSIEEITKPGVIYQDSHIKNLYGIHPREKLTSTDAYLHGEVIIQDRASCFPAEILNYDENDIHSEVIDACAAPGNKTTHAASYVNNHENGVVYAFERDNQRVKVLKTMCEKATGKSKKNLIHPTHSDFTKISPKDFPTITGLIVDPSCSGSGIFGRAIEDANAEEQTKEEIDTERLNKLAGFQFKIMKHALSFPSARKVVYSTCSIHPHENERVVVDLLSDPDIKKQGWTLAKREVVIPSWERRGWEQEFTSICDGDKDKCIEMAGGCVRSVPKEDGGIGFFAACFIRQT